MVCHCIVVLYLTVSFNDDCILLITAGPNAISVSLSPCNHYVLVGLAAKRFTWIFTPKQVRSLVVMSLHAVWLMVKSCLKLDKSNLKLNFYE